MTTRSHSSGAFIRCRTLDGEHGTTYGLGGLRLYMFFSSATELPVRVISRPHCSNMGVKSPVSACLICLPAFWKTSPFQTTRGSRQKCPFSKWGLVVSVVTTGGGEIAQRLERERTDRKVRGSNPTTASRFPLSRLGQPGSTPALVLPSGGTAARHRKGATAERFFNHRGSNLTSVLTRLLASLMLHQLTVACETLTRKQQAGFRPVSCCVDQIFTLHQALEQRHTYK
ncbi:protein kinase [Clonorchis sinensis]|uniref:Protein kinase n=1 Tax=Clonorchis sinensis TaxID=79923 RepID=G7Y3R2_CLOSI|nr:protein kinase [Clonorchis sinensis]